MTTFNHVCACGNSYSDSDPDGYFCPPCVEQRKAIAKTVDAKLANRPKKPMQSDYQIALEKGKVTGNGLFVRAGDLGIQF